MTCSKNSHFALLCMDTEANVKHVRNELFGETNNVNRPLLISILILSVLVNLMCFIVIAKLVKSARKQDQNSPLNRLARAFSTQESQRPDVAAPEIKDEERPIIKNDTESTK